MLFAWTLPWPCVKNGANEDHSIYNNLMTDLRLSEPNDYNFFCCWVVNRLIIGTSAIAKRHTCEKYSLSVSVYQLH